MVSSLLLGVNQLCSPTSLHRFHANSGGGDLIEFDQGFTASTLVIHFSPKNLFETPCSLTSSHPETCRRLETQNTRYIKRSIFELFPLSIFLESLEANRSIRVSVLKVIHDLASWFSGS